MATPRSYVEDGHLVGGYTIRVLYSELTPEEKADFEKRADFHIGHSTASPAPVAKPQ